MSHPWLSVIVPTYNGEAYLRQALESVAAQRDGDIEIIAVDDGSTDATLRILDSFAARLDVAIVRKPHSHNWVKSTNDGLSRARGDYACFLHQDDVWLPERLGVLRPLTLTPTAPTMIVHPSWFIDARGKRLGLLRCPFPRHSHELASTAVVERLLVQNFLAIPAPLFSREAVVRAGGLDERLWYTADWDLWLTLAANGPTAYVARPLAGFRLHGASQTMAPDVSSAEFRRQLTLVLQKHLLRNKDVAAWVRATAQLSVDINVWLAGRARGERTPLRPLLASLVVLGLPGAARYVHHSRIVERVAARLRMRWRG